MQQLLESRSPFERLAAEGANRRGRNKRIRFVGLGLVVLGVLYFSGIFTSSTGKPTVITSPKTNERTIFAPDEPKSSKNVGSNAHSGFQMLSPWGYNKDRNVPRGKAILGSLNDDVENGRFATNDRSEAIFTLVDYGSDQGYFSISVAKLFPKANVIGVEMGGVGGEIWKKADSQDVLSIQEDKIQEHGVGRNMHICQTKVVPEQFFALKDKNLVSDYQFVLSVFHWFDLPTRTEFDKTISTLFLNARTTFIELPIIGDNSPLIRKQVGWKNFVKWYDGRTDMTQIIAEAAEAHGLSVKIALVAAVPWVKWQRETYRVDVLSVGGGEAAPAINFDCVERRKIYRCASRAKYSSCD